MTTTQKQRHAENTICEIAVANYENKPISQEQLQREADYIRAQKLLESLLNKGLVSLSEFNKITILNRESFSPMLAQIMP
mgnify:CR=1 FL=1